MPVYHVSWEIEVDAETPREAAERAFAIVRKPDTTATVFKVIEYDSGGEHETIDLLDNGGPE